MKKPPILTSAQALEVLPLQSQMLDAEQIEMFAPLPSASQTSSASKSLENTGLTSPSSMMSKPSQKTSAKLTSSQQGIHASPFHRPGSGKARQMTVTSGRGCLKLLSKQDPMLPFLKMLLVTSQWASMMCCLTWKMKVTMRGRAYLELYPKTPRTEDKGSGLLHTTWPTPRASEYKDTGPVGSKSHKHMLGRNYLCAEVKDQDKPKGQLSADWVELLMGYPFGWTEIGNGESQE